MSAILTQGTGNEELDKAIQLAGYSYDITQDIFYSKLDSWQRKMGYCRLYDEASAPLGMIMDCEMIHFDYDDRKWMIGLWKGQYDFVTGGEIGIYTEALDLTILGLFKGTFYHCVSNEDLLPMSFTLRKNDKTLFMRKGTHWWLTGFKLGEFSEPSQLRMDVTITLKNASMRNAFVQGLWNTGYSLAEINQAGNSVWFTLDTPRSPQPLTRTKFTDRIIQRKNELVCLKYQEITEPFNTLQDKIKAIEAQRPELYQKILKFGKSKTLYEGYETLIHSLISNSQRGRN
ncbi:hypothetical protein UF75_0528 [Desulfosporosinus sp. I2]|uniref:DUF4474 domain-containing protein n=1 Tax=Desulfosporosinus sp. I2 TaxID=1617025 RepID=UPI0005EF2C90|nr:DUF4474 domain-containing protein [Desulfosporosinus sp. I2]KJR49013.1 hypothetical protein UF75_0528 [Desulfosporosinus sp. I2]